MKKYIGILFLILIVVSTAIGCASPTLYRAVDSRIETEQPNTMEFRGWVRAFEFVQKGEETHTILYLHAYSASAKPRDFQIEVNNQIVFMHNYAVTITFLATEETGIYTVDTFHW